MSKSKTNAPARDDPMMLRERLAEIRARRAIVLREILELEGQRVKPEAPRPMPDQELSALRLLAGDPSIEPPSLSPGGRLQSLLAENAIIDRALELGEQRAFLAQLEASVRMARARGAEWRELIHRKAMLVAELRRLNRETDKFRSELCHPFGRPDLPLAGFNPLGTGAVTGDEGFRFLQEAVKAGIVTTGEITNA